MTRILHVTHQYTPAIGGSEKYITDLSETLAARGNHVDIYTSRSVDYHTWEHVLPAKEVINGVNIYRFWSLRRRDYVWKMLHTGLGNYWYSRNRLYEPLIWYGNGPVSPALFWWILRYGPTYDLIHINHLHYAHAAAAALAAQIRKCPMVITPLIHTKEPATYDIRYLQNILKKNHAILALTVSEKKFLQELGIKTPIVVGGVGIQVEQFPKLKMQESRQYFNLPEDAFVILFLARKVEYKGLGLCIKAFQALQKETNHKVYLLACGPESDYSRELWKEYEGLPNLVLHGKISDEERFHALAACDVLAVPSREESFGIVYPEAWVYSKPVIGTNIDSVSTLITDKQDGLLVDLTKTDAQQVRQLKNYFSWLIENPDAASQMGAQGHIKLNKRYTTERIGDIVEGTYARAIRNHHNRLRNRS